MAEERMPSPEEMKALAAEIRTDEQAARARDYGEADAATYGQRVAEGAAMMQHVEPVSIATSAAAVERAVTQIEQQHSPSYDSFLKAATDQAMSRTQDRSGRKTKEREQTR